MERIFAKTKQTVDCSEHSGFFSGVLFIVALYSTIESHANEIIVGFFLYAMLLEDFLLTRSEKCKQIYRQKVPLYEYIYELCVYDKSELTCERVKKLKQEESFDEKYVMARVKMEKGHLKTCELVFGVLAVILSIGLGAKEIWAFAITGEMILLIIFGLWPIQIALNFMEQIIND